MFPPLSSTYNEIYIGRIYNKHIGLGAKQTFPTNEKPQTFTKVKESCIQLELPLKGSTIGMFLGVFASSKTF